MTWTSKWRWPSTRLPASRTVAKASGSRSSSASWMSSSSCSGSRAPDLARSTRALELGGAGHELLVAQPLHLGFERGDERDDRLYGLEPLALTGVEKLLEDAHAGCECTGGVGGPRSLALLGGPRPALRSASTSFSRTAYIAASVRERSRSFSRMLRTWFLTVFSAITSSAAISLFDMPRATRRSTSTLALGELRHAAHARRRRRRAATAR